MNHEWRMLSPKKALEYFSSFDVYCSHICDNCGSIAAKTSDGFFGVSTNNNLSQIVCHWCAGSSCNVTNCQGKFKEKILEFAKKYNTYSRYYLTQKFGISDAMFQGLFQNSNIKWRI